jgi:hypothetical protein
MTAEHLETQEGVPECRIIELALSTLQLVDGHDLELWQRDSKIGKFEPQKITLNICAVPSYLYPRELK